jgi:hypothetical protein
MNSPKKTRNKEIAVTTGKVKITLLPENGEKAILRTSKAGHILNTLWALSRSAGLRYRSNGKHS